jgi:hypothetical protein
MIIRRTFIFVSYTSLIGVSPTFEPSATHIDPRVTFMFTLGCAPALYSARDSVTRYGVAEPLAIS